MTQATAEIPANEQAEFERELEKARSQLPDNDAVAWTPLPGSQEMFLSCPLPEVLYHGTRGPGKTDALLMSFAQHVGRGFGRSWRGILFRQTYPQLADVVAKAERWFRRIFPRARFNLGKMYWEFPDGEVLFFRHMRKREDYGNYHGHEYQWVGWEELSNWATDDCFKLMFSTLRSSNPDVPRLVRGTTNPYGVGHNWIKDRYRLAGQWNRTIVITDAVDLEGRPEPVRAALHGHIDENTILLESDPTYKDRIAASAANEAQAKAWLNGDWDVVAGGMFDDVWNARWNIVPDFAVPPTWRIDRGLDWGSSRPFSVGWYATSDGSDLHLSDGRTIATVRGDVFRLREWYGWTGRPERGVADDGDGRHPRHRRARTGLRLADVRAVTREARTGRLVDLDGRGRPFDRAVDAEAGATRRAELPRRQVGAGGQVARFAQERVDGDAAADQGRARRPGRSAGEAGILRGGRPQRPVLADRDQHPA